MRPAPRSGFTLVELLVVITIIVVLLSLLAPSLDKAIYRAELTRCMTNLKGVATGVMVYAADQNRRYPDRAVVSRSPSWRAMQLTWKVADDEDDRTVLRDYLSINGLFNDPLGPMKADLLTPQPDSNVFANINLWYGWQWTGDRGMLRLGDRFTWTESTGATALVHTFSLLASDLDAFTFDGTESVQAGHVDRDGILFPYGFQDELALGIKWTYRFWASSGGQLPRRGLVDRNFSYADGSVQTIWDVAPHDPRLVMTPHYGNQASAYKDYLAED